MGLTLTEIKDDERAIGDFYGVHHGLFNYRGNIAKPWLDKLLKSLRISPEQLKEMSCMEAGGSGIKSLTLSVQGSKYVQYIDLSEENIQWMKNYLDNSLDKFAITATYGSITDYYKEFDNVFDLIICSGVIHHTTDPAKALMNLHSWLKTDGILIVNCYRSGGLYFFWAYLIRELMSLIKIEYTEFVQILDFYNFPIRNLELMDHSLVPLIKPTTSTIFCHDLDKLGFEIIKRDEDIWPYHSTISPMLNFVVKKTSSFGGSVDELYYHTGLNQLELDYDQECLNLLRDFFLFKSRLSQMLDRKTAVILSVLSITRIFNESQDLNKSFLRKLRQVQRTKNLGVLLTKRGPKEHFYRNVQQYLIKSASIRFLEKS